ncbi:hypothetical protein R4282_03035 [Rhodococcus oxybenzonivorans]|nr:hypothetical protein [Rhodococcus oxybenzonivorans]
MPLLRSGRHLAPIAPPSCAERELFDCRGIENLNRLPAGPQFGDVMHGRPRPLDIGKDLRRPNTAEDALGIPDGHRGVHRPATLVSLSGAARWVT